MTIIGKWWTTEATGKIYAALKDMGFDSIADYLASNPCQPYEIMAHRIAFDLAPIKFIRVQYEEAKATRNLRRSAIDALVRNIIEQNPYGWGKSENPQWKNIQCLSTWLSEFRTSVELPEYEKIVIQVAEYIRDHPPPEGWKPGGIDDPYLESVFDKWWPLDFNI